MSKLLWDQTGQKLYETGDKEVVLYVSATGEAAATDSDYATGVAWNGITAISETPGGAEATDLWADDVKYGTMRSAETFSGTIEAYMYPDEWAVCDGSGTVEGVPGLYIGQQNRKSFGLSYITTVGNDTELNDYGEKIHIVYGATASPSERSYATINDSPEAITFSWEFETTPVDIPEVGTKKYKKASTIIVDSSKMEGGVKNERYQLLKDTLQGRDADTENSVTALTARLPRPIEVVNLLKYGQATEPTPGG